MRAAQYCTEPRDTPNSVPSSATYASLVGAINWVAEHRGAAPAVISFGFGDAGNSSTIDNAARAAVNDYGITFVAGAGNGNTPAANHSPTRLSEVITVGALASSAYHYGATGVTELRTSFSNYGSAADVFAPSYNNYGAATGFRSGSNSNYGDLGGTSAARAVVAGVAAMYLEAYPNATPAQVLQALIDNATVGALDASTLAGSPNRVIYSNFIPAPTANNFSFSAANYSVREGDRSVTVTVNRSGNINSPASVDFATVDTTAMNEDPIPRCARIDGKASERCDYATTMVTLQFAPGESFKNVTILINDDARAEGDETVPLTLTMAKSGGLGGPNNATLTILDNETVTASFNPIDDARFFVRAHYVDFLSREPDVPGWDFWTNEITLCGSNPQCIDGKRVNTSGSFFLSSEFQSTGYFVYRVFQGSLGRQPNYLEFIPDVSRVAAGIVVNNALSPTIIDANKAAFTREFVTRPEFRSRYDSLGNEAYVDTLAQFTGITLTSQERLDLINGLNNGAETRPPVLYKIVDGTRSEQDGVGVRQIFTTRYGQAFYNAEYNPAFVLMQYFGYLRRNPDDAGYDFWLAKLNQYGNYIDAEMVRSFILPEEYRKRFGQQ